MDNSSRFQDQLGLIQRPFIGQARVIGGRLDALQAALDCLALEATLTALDDGDRAPGGSFHALAAPSAMAAYFHAGQPLRGEGWHRDWFGVAMPLSGRVRVTQYPAGCVAVNGPVFMLPASEQYWQLSRNCELLIFRFEPPPEGFQRLWQVFGDGGNRVDPALTRHLSDFMQRLPLRLHLGLSEQELTRRLVLLRVELLALLGVAEAEHSEAMGEWPLDRRVARVVQRLHTLDHESFDLDELSRLANLSQRGLYYAFQRNLGCSLYQYFKACQLVRVRIALLRDPQRNHSISWHAAREGFQHMSRFAAQYRRHFGEKPSETLAQLGQEGLSQLLR